MAKIRITHEDDAGKVVNSRAATISDMAACYDCFRETYGRIRDAETEIMRDRTDAEVFEAWVGGLMLGTLANVNAYLAGKAQAEVVPPTISAIPEA
jgi:hypothetical protein